jgi:hypothetical protein
MDHTEARVSRLVWSNERDQMNSYPSGQYLMVLLFKISLEE